MHARGLRTGRGERGDTLIEVLLAVVITGATAVAALGGLATTLAGSAQHRALASIDTDLRTTAEQTKYDLELQPSDPWFFEGCPVSWTSTSYDGHLLPLAAPTVSLQSVVFFNLVTNTFDLPGVCSGNDLPGYQQLTFIDSASGFSQTLSIAVRTPG